eukprot:3616444-Pleurochrysis_carterae.AAC.1
MRPAHGETAHSSMAGASNGVGRSTPQNDTSRRRALVEGAFGALFANETKRDGQGRARTLEA